MINMKLDVPIKNLNFSFSIINKLEKLQINTLDDLWKCKRIYLKENGFTDVEIHQLQIQLQLRSLEFNKKIYKV